MFSWRPPDDWDLVGIAVNVLVAVLLIGGLGTYAADSVSQAPASPPASETTTQPIVADVNKRSLAFEAPSDDDDDADDDDEDADWRDDRRKAQAERTACLEEAEHDRRDAEEERDDDPEEAEDELREIQEELDECLQEANEEWRPGWRARFA